MYCDANEHHHLLPFSGGAFVIVDDELMRKMREDIRPKIAQRLKKMFYLNCIGYYWLYTAAIILNKIHLVDYML